MWWTSLEDSWPHEKHIESTALWSQASRFDGALLEKRRGKNSDFRFGVFSLNALFSPIWNLHTLTRDTFHDNFSHGSPNSLSREPKEELESVSRIGRLPVFQFQAPEIAELWRTPFLRMANRYQPSSANQDTLHPKPTEVLLLLEAHPQQLWHEVLSL